MFDCPEQIQTSPTRTFLTVKTLSPLIASSDGPPAFNGPSQTCQRPCASAMVFTDFFSNVTVTFSPAFALPQMRTFTPCCNTMLSPMIDGKRTSARPTAAKTRISNVNLSVFGKTNLRVVTISDSQKRSGRCGLCRRPLLVESREFERWNSCDHAGPQLRPRCRRSMRDKT